MDWTYTLTTIGTLGAFVMYIASRTDRRVDAFEARMEASNKALNDNIDATNKALNEKIEASKKELKSEIKDLDKKIDAVEKDVNRVYSKVSNIEGQMMQMTRPNVIPITRHQEKHENPLDDGDQNVQEC
ncbi:hypothetical protein [Candidatus Neptunochlamydia vexilliferae]|uniref:Uncharacterized protein n=1 Tax=Candidatus Neptunichlamydia vexilliferae TaxID=1651774 RepID=A0ABS0AY75_9BACT|nr:hypothetical protein [Candidatus Neptunochlamydia vexilliferae]MBF5059083.1 hypothetical protein [Candidatus Neptunochlamydia vexilliferae]